MIQKKILFHPVSEKDVTRAIVRQFAAQFDEYTEVGDLSDFALDDLSGHVVAGYLPEPGVLGKLLEPQGDAHFVLVDVQDHAFYGLALLKKLRGVSYPPGPAHVAYVEQAVNTLLNLYDGPVVGQIADPPLDYGARGVLLTNQGSGVELSLLHT